MTRIGGKAANRLRYWKINGKSGRSASGANSFKKAPQAPDQGKVGKLKCPNIAVAASSDTVSEGDPSDQGSEDSFGKQD